ncbi:MAG: TIGR02757 family protein, partial [Bacteroidales bacterium]
MRQNFPLKEYLEQLWEQYECPAFIEQDPIQVPHRFTRNEDIEIAAFLTATISWGQRANTIRSAIKLMQLLDNAPYDYLLNASANDWKRFKHFTYRTFQSIDCLYFLQTLQAIYLSGSSLENLFTTGFRQNNSIVSALIYFRTQFLSYAPPDRTVKHVADVNKGAAAKRLNMFLRWMVRSNKRGVDFGLWKNIPQSALIIPMDVHVVASVQRLGLLSRKNIDWRAAEEVTRYLRQFDPD